MLKKNTNLVYAFLFTIIFYFLHLILFKIFSFPELNLISREILFLVFGLCSLVVFGIIEVIFKKNKDVVGMSFLLISTVKTILIGVLANFFVLKYNIPFEKWNFFILFLLFLGFETFVIGRRLNKTNFS